MLQQIFVLQQQLVDPGLGLQPSCGLCAQLVFQQVDLVVVVVEIDEQIVEKTPQGGRETDGQYSVKYTNVLTQLTDHKSLTRMNLNSPK